MQLGIFVEVVKAESLVMHVFARLLWWNMLRDDREHIVIRAVPL